MDSCLRATTRRNMPQHDVWQWLALWFSVNGNVNNRGGSFATLLGRHPGNGAEGDDSLDTSLFFSEL
jgi:hypothetical protein